MRMGKKDVKGITVKKDDDFSEWYTQVINKAELADIRFGLQGFIVHRPWGFYIIRKIYEALEQEVEKQGHMPFLFPRAVKEKHLTQEAEHAGFIPEVLWVSEAGTKKLEERFALPPTGEAQIYPVYSLWFRSHRDLPFKGYQSRISVFRNEMTTRPFLRGREFLFFETHDVFNTHTEALDQIAKDLKTCDEVIRGKFSIPFFYFKRPAWDKFMGADDTFTPDTVMPDGKRNQLASTHDLGHNFAKAYGIKVANDVGEEDYVYQTCFGPGIWRIMAALIGIHGDDQGLVLPFEMAPVQVVVVPITLAKKPELSKKVLKQCESVVKKLSKSYRVRFDDRDYSPGLKFNEWELKGVPLRIEVGPRDVEKKVVTIVSRATGEKKEVAAGKVGSVVKELIKKHASVMEKRAKHYFDSRVRETKRYKELLSIMKKHRGFVKVPWCSVEKDGETCEQKMKDATQGARVCGTLYPKPEKVGKADKCVACGKKAKHIVYVAKSY